MDLTVTPLLVLVPPAWEALVRAVLRAGATSCLVCPAHAKELVRRRTRDREAASPAGTPSTFTRPSTTIRGATREARASRYRQAASVVRPGRYF
jgi:hypothetical protein